MDHIYLFISPEDCQGTTLVISGQRYHHLAHVRRVQPGAELRAALPDGRVLCAHVVEITRDKLRADVTGETPPTGLSPCCLTLYQALLKGDRMEWVIQKACELGIHSVVPLETARSVPAWEPAKTCSRLERWQRIADAAAQQCERSVPLQVLAPRTPAQLTRHELLLLLHERDGQSLRALAAEYPGVTDLAIAIGPEGGWDDAETEMLRAAGAVPIHLGTRILRAETAAVAAATLAQFLWGDLE